MPLLAVNENDSAVLVVNYFGLFGSAKLGDLASKFNNVIIDNAQGFFAKPIDNLLNIY